MATWLVGVEGGSSGTQMIEGWGEIGTLWDESNAKSHLGNTCQLFPSCTFHFSAAAVGVVVDHDVPAGAPCRAKNLK
jgi:hypothetical protein